MRIELSTHVYSNRYYVNGLCGCTLVCRVPESDRDISFISCDGPGHHQAEPGDFPECTQCLCEINKLLKSKTITRGPDWRI